MRSLLIVACDAVRCDKNTKSYQELQHQELPRATTPRATKMSPLLHRLVPAGLGAGVAVLLYYHRSSAARCSLLQVYLYRSPLGRVSIIHRSRCHLPSAIFRLKSSNSWCTGIATRSPSSTVLRSRCQYVLRSRCQYVPRSWDLRCAM